MCENSNRKKPGKQVWRISRGLRCFEVAPKQLYLLLDNPNEPSPEGAKEIKELEGFFLERIGYSTFYSPSVRPNKKSLAAMQ